MPTWMKSCQAPKSTAPAVLPCDKYQCNKSLLVIQEATKNDRTAIPKKLLEYIVELQATGEAEADCCPTLAKDKKEDNGKPKMQSWCTVRERSAWLITQLQDIFLTHQRWSMVKVNFILHALLWGGSRAFIEEFHQRLVNGELKFVCLEEALAWRKVPQTNPTGAELPSFFSKDKKKAGDTKAAQHTGGEQSGGERRNSYEAADVVMCMRCKETTETEECTFLRTWKSNAAKMECKSTDDFKDCDEIEGRIANHIAYLESLANFRYGFPQVDLQQTVLHDASVWGPGEKREMTLGELESLVLSTVELIKATSNTAVASPACAVSSMIILFRFSNAHLLSNIGAQAMTSAIHILVDLFLEVLREVDKTGLEGTTVKSLPSTSSICRAQRMTIQGYAELTPRQKLAFLAREWYTLLYQFNRASISCKTQCTQVQQMIGMPYREPDWVFIVPQESFEMMKTYGSLHPSRNGCAWCGSEADTPACHPEGEHRVPPCAVHLVSAWRQQVKNARSLFEKGTDPEILRQLDGTLAEAEKEFMSLALSNSSAGISNRQESDSATLTGTFVIRRRGTDGSLPSPLTRREDVEVMYLNQLMGKTTDSIEALLQQDDVVVVCPDDFSATDRLKLADRFVVLKERPLGEGTYGKVYRAWDELLGSYLAAKEVPLDSSKGTAAAVHEALHEYTILTQLHHPHIVAVRAFMVTGSVGTIFMEWMPSGSLQEVLRSNPRGCLREPVVARFMRDALRGLEYLHSRDIMHRDVKPANMLLGTDGSVKLTDFGNSFVMAEGGHTIENNTITGTAPYIAPECAQGTYSPAGDVWSLGCTAVELLSGLVPWSDPVTGSRPETIPLIFRIGMLDDKTRTDRPHTLLWSRMLENAGAAGLSPELRSFLDAIFVVDRHARPTATQLLQHPFILNCAA